MEYYLAKDLPEAMSNAAEECKDRSKRCLQKISKLTRDERFDQISVENGGMGAAQPLLLEYERKYESGLRHTIHKYATELRQSAGAYADAMEDRYYLVQEFFPLLKKLQSGDAPTANVAKDMEHAIKGYNFSAHGVDNDSHAEGKIYRFSKYNDYLEGDNILYPDTPQRIRESVHHIAKAVQQRFNRQPEKGRGLF